METRAKLLILALLLGLAAALAACAPLRHPEGHGEPVEPPVEGSPAPLRHPELVEGSPNPVDPHHPDPVEGSPTPLRHPELVEGSPDPGDPRHPEGHGEPVEPPVEGSPRHPEGHGEPVEPPVEGSPTPLRHPEGHGEPVEPPVEGSLRHPELVEGSPPSRTLALYWDQYQVVTYTGPITAAPPVPPTLHLATKLLLDGRVIYSETLHTGLHASPVTGTGQYNGDFTFHYPDFYGAAAEYLRCWWEGEGWDAIPCLSPGLDPPGPDGYILIGQLSPRGPWTLYMPRFAAGRVGED